MCSPISGRTCATPHACSGSSPAFAAAAVLTLALGIGASTAIFSVVYGVLLKPLPFHEPERLVSLLHRAPGVNLAVGESWPRHLSHLSRQPAGVRGDRRLGVQRGLDHRTRRSGAGRGACRSATQRCRSCGCSRCSGRLFTTEDDAPGSPLRAVLTYGYWQRRFGGAENVIGQSLEIDGTACGDHRRAAPVVQVPAHRCRPCCCRCSSIARPRTADRVRLPGTGPAEAGRRRLPRPMPTWRA